MDNNQLIFYTTPQGHIKVEIIYEDETFWLSQKRIALLFNVDVRTANEHLKHIFAEGELDEAAVIRKFRIVQKEGRNKSRNGVRTIPRNTRSALRIGF